MEEDYSHLKEWLDLLLDEKGWSMDDLAAATRLNRSTLYHYRTDRSRPTPETMQKICDALGVPLSEGLKQFSPRRIGRPRDNRSLI